MPSICMEKRWYAVLASTHEADGLTLQLQISSQVSRSQRMWLNKAKAKTGKLVTTGSYGSLMSYSIADRDTHGTGLACLIPVDGMNDSDDNTLYSDAEICAMRDNGAIIISNHEGPFADTAPDADTNP